MRVHLDRREPRQGGRSGDDAIVFATSVLHFRDARADSKARRIPGLVGPRGGVCEDRQMKMRYLPGPVSSFLLATCAGLALAASAHAQEAVAGAGEVETLGLESGPQDLPGRPPRPPAPTEPTPEELPDWFGGKPYWEWSRAFGDVGGARTALEDWGLTISGSYTFDWTSVWDGGVRRGASSRSLLDINAALDFEKAFKIEGGTAFIDFMSTDMRGGSLDVGDFQSFDNLEAGANVDQISELWYEQKLLDGRLRIKAGKIEANAEFNTLQCVGPFLHSGAGFNITQLSFPTYPNSATGVVVFVKPTEQWYIGGGFFDGSLAVGVQTGRRGPDTLFEGNEYYFIGETGLSWSEVGPLGKGRVAAGGWVNTARFNRIDGGTERTTEGAYVLGEQQLLRRGETDDDDTKGLFIFARYGYADDAIASLGNHVTGGLVLHGTFGGRDNDSTGVLVSFADMSDDPAATFAHDETAIECFYRISVTPFVTITPDFQYIVNPSGSASIDDAVVGGLRIKVSF